MIIALRNTYCLAFKYNLLKVSRESLYFQFRGFLSRHLRRRKFGNYNLVMPAQVSPMRQVGKDIPTPSYYKTRIPSPSPSTPEIKTQEQIEGMRRSCKLAREVLDSLHNIIKVGMTTDELDVYVHDWVTSRGAYPSPLNYRGFPKSICTSVNNVVCHGIPDNRPLHDGDIVNVDITVYYQGYHGDCSAMFLVGEVDEKGKHLVRVTLQALDLAVSICRPGQVFSAIGNTIEKFVKENNLSVVPNYAGHGIGSYFHGPPDINHYANSLSGKMAAGMTFTIEPILSQGSPRMVILDDQWTSVTVDGSRTAQWEHTVLVTPTGVEVLTGPPYVFAQG
uniref:Methionine aminopeptidase n=1 Tax=Cuerna arida TaxID=1464854 RepID=A0A1B6F8M9_9HEMI